MPIGQSWHTRWNVFASMVHYRHLINSSHWTHKKGKTCFYRLCNFTVILLLCRKSAFFTPQMASKESDSILFFNLGSSYYLPILSKAAIKNRLPSNCVFPIIQAHPVVSVGLVKWTENCIPKHEIWVPAFRYKATGPKRGKIMSTECVHNNLPAWSHASF